MESVLARWAFKPPRALGPCGRCLSVCLDWPRIGKEADGFWSRGLHGAPRTWLFIMVSPWVS